MAAPVLEVKDLHVTFASPDGAVQAVRGLDLMVSEGESLGIVGESGSGKSVSMLAVMGLLPRNATVTGSVRFRGEELLGRPDPELRRLRGGKLAMIFQDPMTSLNPVLSVGFQIAEAIEAHHPGTDRKAAMARAAELLDLVGIPNAAARARQYPHEFSGGMRQRAMIAMAIANDPDVLVADEPTTALDVTIQAQILGVLERAQEATGAAILLITHDLGVVAGVADRIVVMYAGRAVETGGIYNVFGHPRHPYTLGLLASLPRLDDRGRERLVPIPGSPPSMVHPPPACAFHPRCPFAREMCREETPLLRPIEGTAQCSACHFAEELDGLEPS
ncbi:MAG TPA: ABC transporter ATP-binding protein [Acidimicrobiia bacterium]|nr:ABC transporter ATP-binding protein [Acidimicrobiia bacterium]